MIIIDKESQEKIKETIKEIVSEKLLKGFKNRSHQPVVELRQLTIVTLPLDEEKSGRDKLIFAPVTLQASVFVELQGNIGQSSNWLNLRINSVEFNYDNDSQEFEIQDSENINITDMTN